MVPPKTARLSCELSKHLAHTRLVDLVKIVDEEVVVLEVTFGAENQEYLKIDFLNLPLNDVLVEDGCRIDQVRRDRADVEWDLVTTVHDVLPSRRLSRADDAFPVVDTHLHNAGVERLRPNCLFFFNLLQQVLLIDEVIESGNRSGNLLLPCPH